MRKIRGSSQIMPATVTAVELAASVAGDGLTGGAGVALAVNVAAAGGLVITTDALGIKLDGATLILGASGLKMGALTGDVTSIGLATTLATVNAGVGTFGSATKAPVITVNAKGLITAASEIVVTPAASSVTGGAALTTSNDTNVTATAGGSATTALLAAASITLGWTGTLAAARLNANVVQGITNDTNVTGTIAAQVLTLGWTGLLGLARGGTHADLSATGGAGKYLKQASAGADVTVSSVTAAEITSGAALTKVDDTNVTLTLGGTPSTALLVAASLTLGWTGTLAAARLNSNVVQSVVNDTNVTGSIAAQALTLGWAGMLGVARGGTGAGAFTAGSVVFAGVAGVYTQDNANLFWDDSNNRLGVGTASPTSPIHLAVTNPADSAVFIVQAAKSSNPVNIFTFWTSRGTIALPTTSQSDDIIGGFNVKAYGTSGFPAGGRGGHLMRTAETWTDAAQGTSHDFKVTKIGTTTETTRLTLYDYGGLGLSVEDPSDSQVVRITSAKPASNPVATLTFLTSRGTTAAPTAIKSGDFIGGFNAKGYGTSAFSTSGRVAILAGAQQDWTDAAHGTFIYFEATPNGSTTQSEKMRLSGEGNLGLGTSALPATGTMGLVFGDGTALASMGSNTAGLFADDVGGTVEMFGINEAGERARLTGQLARNSSQFDAAATTTLATVAGLSRNVAAGITYRFEAVLFLTADAVGGSQFAIAGSATATAIRYVITLLDDATNTYTISSMQTALGGSAGQAGTTAGLCIIRGTITVNAAGTLLVQFAQNAANGTSSLYVNSTFRLEQVT